MLNPEENVQHRGQIQQRFMMTVRSVLKRLIKHSLKHSCSHQHS